MIANYHTHTTRCHHASGSEEQYIERAIQNGLKILGFSEHVPMPFPDGHQSHWRLWYEDLEDYVTTILRLKQQYQNDIRIHLGFEADYYPAYFDEMMRRLSPYDYEYLILGQHFTGNEERHTYPPTSDRAILKQYVDQCLDGLQTGCFTYLAHPDIFHFVGTDTDYETEMLRLCHYCRDHGIPIELNLCGLEFKRHYPTDRLYRLVGQLHVPVIMACDAHATDSVADPHIIKMGKEFAHRHNLNLIDTVELVSPRQSTMK